MVRNHSVWYVSMLSRTSCIVAVTVSISPIAATVSFASAWRLDVMDWMYLRQELVMTSALTNSVVVIARYRAFASVRESALHEPEPSLLMLSRQAAIEGKRS